MTDPERVCLHLWQDNANVDITVLCSNFQIQNVMLGRSSKRHTEQTAPGSNSNARPLPRRPNQNELSSGNDKVDGDRYACTTDSVDDDFIMVKESEGMAHSRHV